MIVIKAATITGGQNAQGKVLNAVCPCCIIRPSEGTSAERPIPRYERNTSAEMYAGSSEASNVTMTEVIKGSIFFDTIRLIGVPRHLDASEYSRSRIIITWLLKK